MLQATAQVNEQRFWPFATGSTEQDSAEVDQKEGKPKKPTHSAPSKQHKLAEEKHSAEKKGHHHAAGCEEGVDCDLGEVAPHSHTAKKKIVESVTEKMSLTATKVAHGTKKLSSNETKAGRCCANYQWNNGGTCVLKTGWCGQQGNCGGCDGHWDSGTTPAPAPATPASTTPDPFALGAVGSASCPSGYEKPTEATCKGDARNFFGRAFAARGSYGGGWPSGCIYNKGNNNAYWNTRSGGSGQSAGGLICQLSVPTPTAVPTAAPPTPSPTYGATPGYTQMGINCNCGARIGNWDSGYETAEKCAAACDAESSCKSFGLWINAGSSPGYCAIFDGVCTDTDGWDDDTNCYAPTTAGKNNVNYNKIAYHLAPAGAAACDFGSSPDSAQCLVAVRRVADSRSVTLGRNSLQSGSGGSCGSAWGAVPGACSAQSGGDWAAHYKSGTPTTENCVRDNYQIVCSGEPSAECQNCKPTQQCYAVGDPHYLSSFGAGKFDFMGTGVMQIAANVERTFKLQAFQCPAMNRNPGATVFKAFAVYVNGDIITIIDNDVLINGKVADPEAGGYSISGTPSTGFTVTAGACASCPSKFTIRRKPNSRVGYNMDMNLILADASSSYGTCAGLGTTSQPDCEDMLFSTEQVQQLSTMCSLAVPDCANPTPVPPPTPTLEICANAGTQYADALQKCTDGLDTTDDTVIQACVLDYCITGEDDTINEFNNLEPTPPPTFAPTPAPTPAPTCPDCGPIQQCYAVGDPHYLSTFGAGKFDFMGKGLFQIAANNEGSFKVQAVQCPALNGIPGAAVFRAFALFVNGDIITIINNEVLINGVATDQPEAGGYTLSGTPSSGVTVTTTGDCEGCRSTCNIRRKTRAKFGAAWYKMDLNLLLADASSSYGTCTGAVQNSQPDCIERLFTDDQMQEIAASCNIDVPDCDDPTPVPPPTPTSEICNAAGRNYDEVLAKCTDGLDTTDDTVIQACVLDYCIDGDDETINEFNNLEPTPPPPNDCADGTCTIADDPHINVFDGRQISLLQDQSHFDTKLDTKTFQRHAHEMLMRFVADGEEGDMWLVKSSTVSIQARYARDDTLAEENLFVKSLAVSGAFMKGNMFVVGDLEQGVTYNGLPILDDKESDFEHIGMIKAKRHLDSQLVQNPEKVNPGINVELPEGVKLLINRQRHYINVEVTMPPSEGGQDGLCGNFNGDSDDDSLELIEKRDPRVASGESLFRGDQR